MVPRRAARQAALVSALSSPGESSCMRNLAPSHGSAKMCSSVVLSTTCAVRRRSCSEAPRRRRRRRVSWTSPTPRALCSPPALKRRFAVRETICPRYRATEAVSRDCCRATRSSRSFSYMHSKSCASATAASRGTAGSSPRMWAIDKGRPRRLSRRRRWSTRWRRCLGSMSSTPSRIPITVSTAYVETQCGVCSSMIRTRYCSF
mmetsp:Transcript_16466/g.46428  ORF Transcript_16466/g.46428 Transcript_16466/m.46428 type:complete len:204 (-) Transcript_16466:2123-2734(-)